MAKKAKKEEMTAPTVNDEWQCENDMRTLMDAEKIKQDPERMKKVHKLAGKQKMAIRSIQQLKDVYNSKYGAKGKMEVEIEDEGED